VKVPPTVVLADGREGRPNVEGVIWYERLVSGFDIVITKGNVFSVIVTLLPGLRGLPLTLTGKEQVF